PGGAGAGTRAFSMANYFPGDNSKVELFVKRLPNGLFGGYLESAARLGDIILLHGPLGSLRGRPSYRKIIMVAGGSGLAPLICMLADLAQKGDRRAVSLFFGAKTRDELYHLQRIGRLCDMSSQLEFVPVVEHPDPEWRGEVGFVTEAVERRMQSLRGYDAYLCGPPPMVEAARSVVLGLGVREPNVYYDAFVPTGSDALPASVR